MAAAAVAVAAVAAAAIATSGHCRLSLVDAVRMAACLNSKCSCMGGDSVIALFKLQIVALMSVSIYTMKWFGWR